MRKDQHSLHGYCHSCEKEHVLPAGNASEHCLELMLWLKENNRIDYLSAHPGNPSFSTTDLFGEARGKMFGVLEGIDKAGNVVLLYGYSGQFNGQWNIDGWVPPLFDENIWHTTNCVTERAIKEIGTRMDTLSADSKQYIDLKRQRKTMSQQLMVEIHALYQLSNFRNQTSPLHPFFTTTRGIPTGTGDCCAPKLLHAARQRNILPRSMAEFFWGRTNRSTSRKHGKFYPACRDKCLPIMGFILCGL